MLLEAFFFWEAPTHNIGFPLSVTLFMVNSTSSRSCSDKSHFHKHIHCVCTQVAQKKKKMLSGLRGGEGLCSAFEWHFHSDMGQNKKTEEEMKIFRMTMGFTYFKTIIIFMFVIARSEQCQMQRKLVWAKWLLKYYFMLPIIYCSFFHKSLPLCWLTVSYSIPASTLPFWYEKELLWMAGS